MDIFLAVLGWTGFAVAVILGLGLNLLGLFGNWLILLAILAAWLLTGLSHFGIWSLGLMFLMAVAGEVLEFAMAGYGARRFGGHKGAMAAALAGAIVGSIAGTPLFPVFGTVLGACAGAFVFAAVYQYIANQRPANETVPGWRARWEEARSAMWTGTGAAAGKIGGMLAKFLCGLVILGIAVLTW